MNNTMAALDPPPPSGPPPTFSETSSASSEVAVGAVPPRPALPLETFTQTDSFPPLPNFPTASSPNAATTVARAARSQSLAIKRKPLSSTASPIATRYSTRDYLDAFRQLPRPEQRFSRSCSLDSPILYEFPDRRTLLPASQLKPAAWVSDADDASQPYVLTRLFAQSSFRMGKSWQ